VKGTFITFEGAEGSGKSTQAKLVCEYLREKNKKVLELREPGGVPISEAVRKILLNVRNKEMYSRCEVLLYMAARAQLVDEVILPTLKRGGIVLCDRYLDSTLVYQGWGNGDNIDVIKAIGHYATQGLQPDMTLIFDIDTQEGLRRTGKVKDRIEQRSLQYHRRVRKGYLEIAKQEPQRMKVINADGRSKEDINKEVLLYIEQVLQLR